MRRKPKLLSEKVKIVKNKKYFNAPLDENNKPYWIPIVVKDKSYLLGFINAYHFISELHGIPPEDLQLVLSSDRFNDVLMDGSRIQYLSRKQLKDKIKTMYFVPKRTEHSENVDNLLDGYYLSLNCVNCGVFYSFNDEQEIPEEDFICSTCGNALISYINQCDEYFDFEGIIGDVDKIIEEINKEN